MKYFTFFFILPCAAHRLATDLCYIRIKYYHYYYYYHYRNGHERVSNGMTPGHRRRRKGKISNEDRIRNGQNLGAPEKKQKHRTVKVPEKQPRRNGKAAT